MLLSDVSASQRLCGPFFSDPFAWLSAGRLHAAGTTPHPRAPGEGTRLTNLTDPSKPNAFKFMRRSCPQRRGDAEVGDVAV